MRKFFTVGQLVEFCPVSCRDTSQVKWRDGVYVGPVEHRWHRVKVDSFGTVECLPLRRIRKKGTP